MNFGYLLHVLIRINQLWTVNICLVDAEDHFIWNLNIKNYFLQNNRIFYEYLFPQLGKFLHRNFPFSSKMGSYSKWNKKIRWVNKTFVLTYYTQASTYHNTTQLGRHMKYDYRHRCTKPITKCSSRRMNQTLRLCSQSIYNTSILFFL